MSAHIDRVFPGVYHITDCMGFSMTLLTGHERAVLIDAGYGLEPVPPIVRQITDLPCRLILSHGHHDHAMGAIWFDSALMHPDDFTVYAAYTAQPQREKILESCRERGRTVDENRYLHAQAPSAQPLNASALDLGGLDVRVIHCPGHTPGSLMFYLPAYQLLLTGDNWNPTTWLFFPEALSALAYRENMRRTLADIPFRYALCPHQPGLRGSGEVTAFLEGLTDDALRHAVPCEEGKPRGIQTARCTPAPGQSFVFDTNKVH